MTPGLSGNVAICVRGSPESLAAPSDVVEGEPVHRDNVGSWQTRYRWKGHYMLSAVRLRLRARKRLNSDLDATRVTAHSVTHVEMMLERPYNIESKSQRKAVGCDMPRN